MATKIAFDVQRLIDEVAVRHRLVLKPDDAAFAIVTMNRLVLEESLEAIHSHIVQDLALFEAAAKKTQIRAGIVLAAEVRESAAGIRQELGRDVQDARLQASEIVRQVEAAYQQRMSAQKLTITVLAAVLLFCCGVWAGRISAMWWPL
jgi:hypothetical protein